MANKGFLTNVFFKAFFLPYDLAVQTLDQPSPVPYPPFPFFRGYIIIISEINTWIFYAYIAIFMYCHTNLILRPITGDSKVFLSIEFYIGHLLQKSIMQMDIFGIVSILTFHGSY